MSTRNLRLTDKSIVSSHYWLARLESLFSCILTPKFQDIMTDENHTFDWYKKKTQQPQHSEELLLLQRIQKKLTKVFDTKVKKENILTIFRGTSFRDRIVTKCDRANKFSHTWSLLIHGREQAISGGAQTTTPSRAAERQKRREKIQGLDHMMITWTFS